ncbi:MAG: pyridoxamine 5'-phosphate oxidase family protein [Alphaproteobacteria bacterium]|nr:MAG: pyridoxamine 5'-phosphate oxidase family protein [Alphaproteobacteria bacterium]
MPENRITTIEELYGVYKAPSERVIQKELKALDPHCRHFISISPFLVLGSSDGNGAADASPRGDTPGFVKVLDDRTLLIPDRPGNNRLDTLQNIVRNPAVGLIFMVPGMNETLRINGDAHISTDPELLKMGEAQGKLPASVIVVEVKGAYMHCAKAFIRSKLWAEETKIDRKSFPSLGQIMHDQMGGMDPDQADKRLAEAYKTTLY